MFWSFDLLVAFAVLVVPSFDNDGDDGCLFLYSFA